MVTWGVIYPGQVNVRINVLTGSSLDDVYKEKVEQEEQFNDNHSRDDDNNADDNDALNDDNGILGFCNFREVMEEYDNKRCGLNSISDDRVRCMRHCSVWRLQNNCIMAVDIDYCFVCPRRSTLSPPYLGGNVY